PCPEPDPDQRQQPAISGSDSNQLPATSVSDQQPAAATATGSGSDAAASKPGGGCKTLPYERIPGRVVVSGFVSWFPVRLVVSCFVS
ncbi:MAG TPA: hypothetical protein VLT32_02770, partial [Candidatus Sulfomarinibacteraceae bacterium]|nr:hypothetical protein [Candidatus Sulfomarinibacteraceae bacterium]